MMQPTSKGIDVSHWNNIYNPDAIRKDGIDFAILREGYGSSIDKSFVKYFKVLKSAGIKIPGVYHFAYAINEKSAIGEAYSCAENLDKAGVKPSKNFTVFYDFEYDTVSSALKRGIKLTPKECNLFTRVFCETIESLGYTSGIYFNLDYYRNWYDPALLNKYTKWLAYWNGQPLYDCDYHQYFNKGQVSGMHGDVDMNYFYDKKKPSKTKTVEKIAKEVLDGKWGNGQDRYKAITSAGYNYYAVQAKVNEMIQNGSL